MPKTPIMVAHEKLVEEIKLLVDGGDQEKPPLVFRNLKKQSICCMKTFLVAAMERGSLV